MKKLRELLRLKQQAKLKNRQIGKALAISASTVSYYLRGSEAAGISWPLPESMTDKELMLRVEPFCQQLKASSRLRDEPDWAGIHKEMQYKHMTLQLAYEEYLAQSPCLPYSYSHFSRKYKRWRKQHNVTMPIVHEYGDKCFLDYAGDTITIYDKDNQPLFAAQIFIAVLGASKYTFVIASRSQQLPDWIASNVAAFEFFGGVPALLVPDNLKSAITDSCKYDPISNPTYADMAEHYGTAILPARSYKPRDKASAENAVLIVERWIIARLRKHKFYSLAELNNKLRELVIALNNKPLQRNQGSRNSIFVEKEKPTLKPLPSSSYKTATFRTVKVQNDYHICINNHFYSVPYHLASVFVECRITANTIEVLHDGQRVTSHFINQTRGGRTTLDKHMPRHHQEQKNWTEEVFLTWSRNIGPGVFNLASETINNSEHKDRTYRFHLGLKQLAKQYSPRRLEAACLRALAIGALQYKNIKSILSNRIDLQPHLEGVANSNTIHHHNIRGKQYYANKLQDSE